MACCGTQFTPSGRGRAIGKLDGVEKIGLDPAHLRQGHVLDVAEYAGFASKPNVKRLGTEVFAKLKSFEKPHAIRFAVIPRPPDFRALLQWTDRVLPVVGGWNRAAFYHAATGKPDEAGFQTGDHLRNVRPQSIRTVFESFRRKKRNHVKPDGALRTSGQDKAGVSIAFHAGEGGIVLL